MKKDRVKDIGKLMNKEYEYMGNISTTIVEKDKENKVVSKEEKIEIKWKEKKK